MSSSFDRHGVSLDSSRQPRGLRRQADRARRRDRARRERQGQLDVQQLEQRLALAITVSQNVDALVPYALITSDAGDRMYMTNLGTNVYAVADNSQFLDGGSFERHEILETQRIEEIFVTDALFVDTTSVAGGQITLAHTATQEFALLHGGLIIDPDVAPRYAFRGTLHRGNSSWSFFADGGGALSFVGNDSGRPESGSVSKGYQGDNNNAARVRDGLAATVRINWGLVAPDPSEDIFLSNLSYAHIFPDQLTWSYFPNFWSNIGFFSDSTTQYRPGVQTGRTGNDNKFDLLRSDLVGSSADGIVPGSVGVKTFRVGNVPTNEPGVLHLQNFGDVYFKSVAADEGEAVVLGVSRTKEGPFRYFGQGSSTQNGVTTRIVNPVRQWVFLESREQSSGVGIALSATLNTDTGLLNVVTRRWLDNDGWNADDQERAYAFNPTVGPISDNIGELVNPGHVSVDLNFQSFSVARDPVTGKEVSSTFTVYDGHNIQQKLSVDLLGTMSSVHIDSPVLQSHGVTLRANSVRIDAPVEIIQDPDDPGLDVNRQAESLQVTTGKLIIGGSKRNPATTAQFVDVNAAVSAVTGYEIEIAGSPQLPGWLYVSPTGSLGASLDSPLSKPSQVAFIDARSADVVIEGAIHAEKQTILFRSDSGDTNRHYLTTTSKYTGVPVGVVKGSVVAILLGNSTAGLVPRPGDSTYIPTYVTLQTDIDTLRVRAAHSNVVGPTDPLQYEMKISEANDITIDAIAASGLPITLSSQGAMTFKASVETRSDLTINVAKAFTVSAPLSSSAGTVKIIAGTDLTVNNSVKAGGIDNAEAITLIAGNNYATLGTSQNGGALKINALVDSATRTVVLKAFGDRSKNSAADSTVRQGTIYGTSRVRGESLSIESHNTVTLGSDVGAITGRAAAGISVTQDIDLNSYPVLAHKELLLDNLTTGFGNIAVTAGANIVLKDVVAGTAQKGDGDVLISSTGIRQRSPGSLVEFVSEGTNITLSEEGVVMAINDRVRLHAPTGEIFGTSVPVASWLDWTAIAVPEADGLYDGVEKLSAYLKSGRTMANLVVSAPASITLEEIKTDNGNVTVTAAGAIIATKVEAVGSGSEITLTTTTAGNVAVGSLAAAGRVEVKSAGGITASAGGGRIAGLTAAAPVGEAVLRAQADVGKSTQRLIVDANSLTVTDNEIADPQNVFITLTARKTVIDVKASTIVDVNSVALFNDIAVSSVSIGEKGTVTIQATRNIDVAGAIGAADARAKIVSLTATSGALTWGEGGQVSSETVSLTAMRDLGDADKFQTVFGDVETFQLARTGQGDINANFSRQSAVKLDGVRTAGGSVFITNKISGGDPAGAVIHVTSKGIMAGGGGSVTLDASDQVVSGMVGTSARGVIKADGRVSLRAGSLIDVTTSSPLLWANTTGESSNISITTTGDVKIAASSDGKAVAAGTPAGIFAGNPETGTIDGNVSLNVLGKLTTEKNAWVGAATATVLARSGIGINVDVSGPMSATTNSGDLGLTSKGSLLVGSRGVNAAGGNVEIKVATETGAVPAAGTGRMLAALYQEDTSLFGITGRAVTLNVEKAGAIDVKTSATVLNASTFDGDIWITERDNVAVGTKGIVARTANGAGKGDVYLSARGGFTTQQVMGTADGKVSAKNVTIDVGNLLAIATAADFLTVNSVRGDVQIVETDAVTLKVNAVSGAIDVRAGDKLTVTDLKTNGSRAAVTLTAGPLTGGGALQGSKPIVLTLADDPDTLEQLTPIRAAGSIVTLRGSTVTQDDDSRASVVATALSVHATGAGEAIRLVVSSNAISASAPAGSINITHSGVASTPLVLGAVINGTPAAIRAGGNVTISSSTSDIVVAVAPIAGRAGTVSIETQPEDRSVTFIVTTNADMTSAGVAVAGSLRSTLSLMKDNSETRQAIAFSNAITAPIMLSRSLDPIARRTSLDGTRRFVAANNQFINGAGTPIIIDGSQIKGSAEANGISFAAGADGSSIKGFAIQGFRNGAGVKVTDASNVTIEGNTLGFVRSNGPVLGNKYGVQITSESRSSNGNRILSNAIGSNTAAGIFVSNIGTTNTVIQRNQIGTTNARVDRGNAGHGVHVWNAGAGTVIGDSLVGTSSQTSGNGNLFMFNGSPVNTNVAAVLVASTNGVVLKGNEFVLNKGRGMHLHGSNAARIVGNTFTRNGEDALYIEASTKADVTGNFIGTDRFRTLGQGNQGAGLRGVNGSGHVIRGNAIANNRGVGIGLYGSAGNSIGGPAAADRNTIAGNLTGVVVSNGGTASVTSIRGNAISNNAIHGIEVEKATRVAISDGNIIELNGTRRECGSGVTVRNEAIATIFGNAIRGNGNAADDSKGFRFDGIRRELTTQQVAAPTVSSVSRATDGGLTVSFTASGLAGATVWVDLYQSESMGQGSRYLGRQSVTLVNGMGALRNFSPAGGVAANTSIVMTVTTPEGHTSSFSAARLVT